MILKADIYRVVIDFFRTELEDGTSGASLSEIKENATEFFSRLPREVKRRALEKASVFFGYAHMEFSSLDLMTDYAYAAYLKNRRVMFTTKGSSGLARRCVHTEEMLEEETAALKPFFKDCKRIVSLVPANDWYGFVFTVWLPDVLGVPVEILPTQVTQPWEGMLKEGDAVVSVPLFWNYWLRAGNKFAPGVTVVSSTAAIKNEMINRLFGAGLGHFIEVYGSSQTGPVALRTNAGAPFELLDFWEVSRRADTPKFKRKSQPEWQMLPDELAFVSDRLVRPLRRKQDCVEVDGQSVYVKEVEQILAHHPAVRLCRVRMMRPEEGDQLKAFVVLKEGYTPEHEGMIRAYLSQKLTPQEMPRLFTFGAELPTAALGKESDW